MLIIVIQKLYPKFDLGQIRILWTSLFEKLSALCSPPAEFPCDEGLGFFVTSFGYHLYTMKA